MASERVLRRIDRLIDEIEAAADQRDWRLVLRLSEDVLAVDPANADAAVYGTPTSFANDRYRVKRFLGEGGKKKVYLAQDTKNSPKRLKVGMESAQT